MSDTRHEEQFLAIERREAFGRIQHLFQVNPANVLVRDPQRWKRTPVHIACMQARPSLEVIQYLVQLCPQVLMTVDAAGDTPLHHACTNPTASLAIVQFLTEQCPNAINMFSNSGLTPFHMLLYKFGEHDPDWVSKVKYMVQTFPGVLEISCRHSPGTTTPIHSACRNALLVQVLECFLETNPSLLDREFENGRALLHLCVNDQVHASLHTVETILRKRPDAAQIRDCDGRTPLHLFCMTRFLMMDIIDLLVQYCPRALTMQDKDGCTPLHLACKYAYLSTADVEYLAELCPLTLEMCDAAGNLPVHYAAMRGNAVHVSVVYSMLRFEPASWAAT